MCDLYKNIRGFGEAKLRNSNKNSANFPIAFSILVYNNVEQFERFLHVLYEPTNVYCIHIDAKSSDTIKRAIMSIVNCFDNVFVTTHLERIIYAGYSRLKADLNCIHDLLNLNNLIDRHENLIHKRLIEWKYIHMTLYILK